MPEISTKTAGFIAIAGALGTLVGATIAPLVNYWTNERQMDVKMVEIGIGILRAPPKEDIAVMRSWAIDVIEKSSGRRFSTEQRAALLKQELPIQGVAEWERPSKRKIDEIIRGLQEGRF